MEKDGPSPIRSFRRSELLVVVWIVLISAALIIPAVQKSREASKRMKCATNLRQIATALHNYYSGYLEFPAGGITTEAGNFTNWAIEVIPFIEASAWYARYEQMPTTNENQPQPEKTIQYFMPPYVCPSDVDIESLGSPIEGPGKNQQWARGSYRAVAGRGDDGETFWDTYSPKLDRKLRGALHAVGIDPIQGGTPKNTFAGEKFEDFKDGVATTLLVGEHAEVNLPRRRTFWAATDTYWNKSSITPQSRILGNDYEQCVAVGGAGGDLPCKRSFGSMHTGGLNFLFADGHVQFIGYKCSIEVLAAGATIDGDEVIKAEDFDEE